MNLRCFVRILQADSINHVSQAEAWRWRPFSLSDDYLYFYPMESSTVGLYSGNPSTMSSLVDGLASYEQFRIVSLYYSHSGPFIDSNFLVIDITDSQDSDPVPLLPDPEDRSMPLILCISDSHREYDDLLAHSTGLSFTGFIHRDRVGQTIGPALMAVASDLEVYPTGYRRQERASSEEDGTVLSTGSLTDREISILRSVARGLPSKAIARDFGVSERTVKFHINSIFAKFGVHTRTEAAIEGARKGLIPL